MFSKEFSPNDSCRGVLMFAKRSSRALALLLALPSAAFALGLGDIHLLSPLNAPLDAEIELVDIAPDELNTVQVQLASRDTFAKYGLDWPAYLSGVQLKTQRTADGREVIKLKSTEAISEPFVTLLVEVNWARGRLVREYTMLLDPPVYAPGQSAVASAPVTAPGTTAGTREGSIARATEAPPAQAAPVAPQATAERPTTAEPAAVAPAPSHHARAAAAAAAEPAPSGDSGATHTVQRGETLSGIASGVAGAGVNSAQARSWIVAIYNANPEAFRKNMNVMRSGAVLRIPDASEAAAISAGEASAEIHRQYTAWRGAAGEATPAPAEQPGRLKLVTPSGPAAANATPVAPGPSAKEAAAAAAATAAAATAAKEAESKRLLELKNEELARLQAQNAAKQAPPAPAPPVAQATPPAATAPAPAPAEQAPAPSAEQAPAPSAEQAPAPSAEQAPPEVQAAPPAPVQKPKAVKPAAPSGGSFLATLLSYWWILAVIALGLLGFLALRLFRSRRATTELDDSLGRMAAAGADAAEFGSMSASRGFSQPDPIATPRTSAPLVPDSFLVEETGSHERPRLSTTGQMPAMATPKHVASSDETISSETAINLDQGDPLAEADFHMAYGLYDQAADLIRIAISREPARRDLKLKLLEVFFVWGNKDQFLSSARELAQSRSDAAPGEWEKILIMGKQLAPEDALFSGGGAISGASAGGVDLDLEGGQSRVDFDLVGDEPLPTEVAHGVDLDIGSAVGGLDSTAESQSNITDRNAALLEGSFLGGATTRQMTGRMRPSGGGSTAEMEGPTVEQPTLGSPDNPTIRQKLETAMRKVGTEHTAELAIDDLGLDVGQIDTIDQPGITSAAASTPDAPTLVAGLDDQSRRVMEDAHRRAAKEDTGSTTGAWQFDQGELEAALTQTSQMLPDASATSRMRALSGHDLDVDVGDATGQHMAHGDVDLDVGVATDTHESHGGGTLDLDVGTATVPDAAFAATQRLASDDLALPDLEPVTMSEVGTKLDLARAYMDMGDPDGARNILEEVLSEGSAAQKQEAQRLIESLPG
jgi:pilus assembly protein FimV